MLKFRSLQIITFSVISLFYSLMGHAQSEENLDLSGFFRGVAGYLEDEDVTYLGYDDSISVDQQSLLGLQADYQLTNKLNAVGQAIAHSADERESGIEWLYLNYRPTAAWQFKLGKQRTPFFTYSDILDVGFAYPWISPPNQVYKTYFFSTMEGLLTSYDYVGKNFAFNLEAYWGVYEGDIYNTSQVIPADVSALRGIVLSSTGDNWSFRAAYHVGTAEVELPGLSEFSQQLRQFGFFESASSINFDGDAEYLQFGISYENIDYFFKTEWTRIESDISIVPTIDGYYASLGYIFYPFTAHITFANSGSQANHPVDEIPIGINPQLDALAFGYRNVFNSVASDTLKSLSAGLRWDLKNNIAIKGDVTWLENSGNGDAWFERTSQQDFDGTVTLFQISVEWVF